MVAVLKQSVGPDYGRCPDTDMVDVLKQSILLMVDILSLSHLLATKESLREKCINHMHPTKRAHGSFHAKSTQKKYDPSRFSSNFVSVSYLWSNSASPSFKLIRQVFLDLWSLKCHNFYDYKLYFMVCNFSNSYWTDLILVPFWNPFDALSGDMHNESDC